jgi:ribosomal-protein-alanine N-acetyltransferase
MADGLQLSAPSLADAEALLDFELANRAYFERWISARADGYYTLPAVREAIEQAARERAADQAYQFLLKEDGAIVGRVNLRAVTRPYFNKATLGYRIGERCVGRGYASRAVALALEQAFGALELWRVEATSRPENAASVRVLERNGFTAYGRATRAIQMHGTWGDLLQFERHRDLPV